MLTVLMHIPYLSWQISVSTLQTTQSDRLAAARAAALSVPRRGRYGALTPSYHLDEFDLEALMAGAGLAGTAGRKKIPKQVLIGLLKFVLFIQEFKRN